MILPTLALIAALAAAVALVRWIEAALASLGRDAIDEANAFLGLPSVAQQLQDFADAQGISDSIHSGGDN